VIQASHPNANVASIVASNWLMGLFEPKKDIAFMNFDWPDEPIKQSGLDVVINSNLVTKTNKVDLLSLYKLIRREFNAGIVDQCPWFPCLLKLLLCISVSFDFESN
jgi:hypothetical protein